MKLHSPCPEARKPQAGTAGPPVPLAPDGEVANPSYSCCLHLGTPRSRAETRMRVQVIDLGGDPRKHQVGGGARRQGRSPQRVCYQAELRGSTQPWGPPSSILPAALGASGENTGSYLTPRRIQGLPEFMNSWHFCSALHTTTVPPNGPLASAAGRWAAQGWRGVPKGDKSDFYACQICLGLQAADSA